MTQANTTAIEAGMTIIIDDECVTIESIKGRWVKTSTGDNISRTRAQEAREQYLEDAETLGIELDNPEQEEQPDEHTHDDTVNEEADTEEATGYAGPMLVLRERLAAGAYQKAVNGQPCCGDAVATILGTLKPQQVIRACILAMNLPANPYAYLNVGQQSMNLRNKLRGCFKRGEFGMGVLAEAVEQVQEEALQTPPPAAV